tara:strand:+ start:305 stop:604 length:300 start_codon:yes stop_codon:yes gene_type:complete
MSDFQEFGNILAKRYAQAVGAANKQRAQDQPVTQDFEFTEQSSFNQEPGGPTPPEMPSTNDGAAQFETISTPPEDQDTEDMKNFLLKQSKKRFQADAMN